MSLRQYYTKSYASEQELKPLLHNSRIESALFCEKVREWIYPNIIWNSSIARFLLARDNIKGGDAISYYTKYKLVAFNMNLILLIHQFHSTKLKYISALDVYQPAHLVMLYKVIWGHSRSLHLNSPSPADRHQSFNLQCNCNNSKLVIGNSFHKKGRKKISLSPKQQVSDSPRPAERRADRTAFSS